MKFNKSVSEDGSVELSFQSKNIPGSPLGLLAIAIPLGCWLAWKLLLFINPNMEGGGLFALLVIFSAVLVVGGYITLKNIIFVKSHHIKVNKPEFITIDGNSIPYKQIQGFGLNRKNEQARIFVRRDGKEIGFTGWMNEDDAEKVLDAIRK